MELTVVFRVSEAGENWLQEIKAVDAPVPAVGRAKRHLLVPRLLQGHLNLDLNRLFYYYKICNDIFSLTVLVRTVIFCVT